MHFSISPRNMPILRYSITTQFACLLVRATIFMLLRLYSSLMLSFLVTPHIHVNIYALGRCSIFLTNYFFCVLGDNRASVSPDGK